MYVWRVTVCTRTGWCVPERARRLGGWEKFNRLLYESIGSLCLNINFWAIPYFLIDFNFLITTTRSTVSNYLTSLPLFRISLCLRLLPDNRMLNISLYLNIIRDAASKWYKACCPSELPSLDLDSERYIGNGKSLTIASTNREMSVSIYWACIPSIKWKNNSCKYWWRLSLSAEFIFFTLLKYLWNL